MPGLIRFLFCFFMHDISIRRVRRIKGADRYVFRCIRCPWVCVMKSWDVSKKIRIAHGENPPGGDVA